MFVLFGFGHTKVKKVGETKINKCSNCSNEKPFDIVERSKWFTLFFIPVFPYSKEKAIVCPVCKSIKQSEGKVNIGQEQDSAVDEANLASVFKEKEATLKKSLEAGHISLNNYKKEMNLLKFEKSGSLK